MAAITAKDVAALRAKTGIGMMECKKALVEADGDVDAAIKILREKGELKAESKMATRIAADGLVEIRKEGDLTAMIEVNSETDFVAKNETFKAFVTDLLKIIIAQKPATVEALMACRYDDGSPLRAGRGCYQHLYSRKRLHRRCGEVQNERCRQAGVRGVCQEHRAPDRCISDPVPLP